jgi:hypothetical protein
MNHVGKHCALTMLSFFSKKPDHPLADAREAKRILAEISSRDPQGAVEEASVWLESLSTAEGFKLTLRLERILQLDEAVAPQVRRLGREFVNLGRVSRMQETRLWNLSHAYWQQLVAAYLFCLEEWRQAGKDDIEATRSFLPLLYLRLMQGYAALLKWDQFRYGPVGDDFWADVGRLYLAAEAESLARKPQALYPGQAASSIESEYLKALLFQASSMDKLLPLEIELAERLIAWLLPHFTLTAEARPENVYWVDAAKSVPPTRLAKLPAVSPTLRFFNGGKALVEIEKLQARIAADHRLPPEVNLGGQYEIEAVCSVLDHLAAYWAPKPPMRSHARHQIKSRLVVTHGMASAHAYISGRESSAEGVEVWVVGDVSLGGMGALVPITRQDWIRIGTLVALQPEGGSNWLLGIVRRFARSGATQGQVGVETLSKTPFAVIADAGGLQTEGLLLDLPVVGEYARMVLPPAALEEKVALLFALDGKRARLHPREIFETGEDYLVANFFVQSFS